jgi:ABC-type nitrate/sulfonate/bicarbonate transport system substrate-binding protein
MVTSPKTLSLILALAFSLMVGCTPAAPTATSAPPTSVKFQMSWVHEYSAAGFYEAEINGHFAKENLDVELQVGGFVDGHYIEPIDEVISGKVDFGLSDATSVLQARAAGKPIVAIAAVLQRNPTAVIFLDNLIQQPKDLIGKTVAVSEGGATQVLNVMLTSQGIDPKQVNIVPRTDFGVGPLIDGSVDALVGWIINEGVAVKEAGGNPGFLLLSDYGIPNYVTLIVASEDTVKNRSDLADHFVQAVINGWEDVVKNPEKAVTDTLTYDPNLDHDQQLNRLQATIPLLQPARTKIGVMDQATWENISKVLRDAEMLTQEVDVKTAFTTAFLDNAQ